MVLLADSHMTMVVGIDVHVTTTPPFNPLHPYIGMVLDVADYIPFLGTNVSVNGLKRGVSDTGGIIIPLMHIPLVGPFLMTAMIGHESMNFFASESVLCDGSRVSPKGYMVMTCNDVGIPLSASLGGKPKKPRLIPSLFAPTSYSLPIPTGKPVMVGGPYPPDWGGMLKGLVASIGFSALMKLGRKGLGKALKAFNHKVLKNSNIQKHFPSTKKLSAYLCKNGFEPVNLVNGAVIYEGSDFGFPSPLPLAWNRSWYSDSDYDGWLGHGCHSRYDRTAEAFPEEGVTMLRMEDGRAVGFPLLEEGEEYYNRTERTTLRRTPHGYEAYSHDTLLTCRFTLRDKEGWRLTEIENPEGLRIRLHFNGTRLAGISDPAGRTVHAVTDSRGRIVTLLFDSGEGEKPLVSYEYSDDGDMTGITDTLGKTTRIEYRDHHMVTKTDRNGDTYYWEYDRAGRCIHTWGPGGMMEGHIEYHPEEGRNLVTDATGGVSEYRYTPEQLITAEIDPLGNETRHSYTEYMEPYRTIDPEGGVTGYSYDDMGNLTGISYPDGTSEMYVYDEESRLVIHVDREGNKEVWLYGTEHPYLASRIIDASGEVTELEYDRSGQPVVLRRGERRSELAYDREFNLVSWHEDGHRLCTWEYDRQGHMTGRLAAGSLPERYRYDRLGRIREIHGSDGNVIHLGYDSYDSVTEARDAYRHIRMGYNSVGSMTWREESGHRVSFRYDNNDRLREVVNEAGSGYHFGRDLAGNIDMERDYGGIERRYRRDRCGRVTHVERPGGRSTAYTYDPMGRVIGTVYHDGSREEYGYDRNGQLTLADNGAARIRIERDPLGRVTRESMGLPGGDRFTGIMSVESEYDRYGGRTRVSSSLGADAKLGYDRLGLVRSVSAETRPHESGQTADPNPDGGKREDGATAEGQIWASHIERDDSGRETERFATGGIRITTDYNSMGLVRSRQVRSGDRLTGWRSYRWDVGARLLSMRCSMRQGAVFFDYDSLCNLVRGDYSLHDRIFRTPDKVGNLYREPECRGRRYDRGGRLLWDGEYHYSYDCEGNLVRKSRREHHSPGTPDVGKHRTNPWVRKERTGRDIAGSTIPRKGGMEFVDWEPGDTCYEWQPNGMLAGVRTADGMTVMFGYDALGRRVSKRIGDTVRRFGWDGNVLLHEWEIPVAELPRLVVSEDGSETYDGPETYRGLVTWVYDGESFTPVAKVTEKDRYTIVHDYLGTPTQAYDSAGNLVWEMLLDVYGRVMESRGDRSLVPFRYQGQYEDWETGLYYNRFRYYSPEMGMYISSDPIGLAGNNPTLYGYVQDVNTWLDVWGLEIKRIYEKAPYHGVKDNSIKSRAPIDGQGALDNSIQVKETNPRRVGIDPTTNEFVILDRTRVANDGTEIYHGHVRSWDDMTVEQQNALIKNKKVNRKGKIKCKN